VVWSTLTLLSLILLSFCDLWLAPAVGDVVARSAAIVLVALLICLLTATALPWMAPRSAWGAVAIGASWACLTTAVEVAFAWVAADASAVRIERWRIYLMGVVLLTLLLAPWLVGRSMGMFRHDSARPRAGRAAPP
jgi:hypothetical protein